MFAILNSRRYPEIDNADNKALLFDRSETSNMNVNGQRMKKRSVLKN